MDLALQHEYRPRMVYTIGGLALLWNAYGVLQFVGSLSATPESLVAAGLTETQAVVMTGYPAWMTFAFALGVFGGLVGSVLLLLRNKSAAPVFHVSLVGYVALYFGDIVHGVFAAMGIQQVVILTFVVLIAAGLSLASRVFTHRGQLT